MNEIKISILDQDEREINFNFKILTYYLLDTICIKINKIKTCKLLNFNLDLYNLYFITCPSCFENFLLLNKLELFEVNFNCEYCNNFKFFFFKKNKQFNCNLSVKISDFVKKLN